MTDNEYAEEWGYLYDERLGMICEDSSIKGGQRQESAADVKQARQEADEMMAELEKDEA